MMRLWGELQEIIKVRMARQELVKCLYPTEGHASTSDEKDTNKLVIFLGGEKCCTWEKETPSY